MSKFFSDVFTLVEINLKIRYRQTFIGFLWVIANPILLFFIQNLVLVNVLNEPIKEYSVYLFSGLLPWFYLSHTAQMGCTFLKNNSNLVKNLRIHPFKFITSLAVENLINLFFASTIIFIFLRLFLMVEMFQLVNFYFWSLWMFILVTLITFISSILNVIFKDTQYILHFLFTVLYFTTPSFYYIEKLPILFQKIIVFNPFYWILNLYRFQTTQESVIKVIAINLGLLALLVWLSVFLWKNLKAKIYLKL